MPKLVLIVDDDSVFVESVSVVLETRYRVCAARNGEEAMRLLDQHRPDLVILDVMMDYLSEGFDVARALRASPSGAHVKIMMLTGVDRVFNFRLDVDEAWLPCDRYVEKPVTPQELLEHVSSLLEGREP